MNSMKFACVLAALAAVGPVGCGGDDGSGTDGGPSGVDSGPPPLCTGGMCPDRFYVVNFLDVGQSDPDGDGTVVPGFNLDGRESYDPADPATQPMSCGAADDTMFTQGCFHADFRSPAPDNECGVDNQLGPILGSLGDSVDVAGSI